MSTQKKIIEETYQDKKNVDVFDSTRERYKFQRYKHQTETNFLIKAIEDAGENSEEGSVKVLDVACGTGRMFREIADFYHPDMVEYHGVDTSLQMTEHLIELSDKVGYKAKLRIADATTAIPWEDDTFDVTFSFHLTWHLPLDLQYSMLAEMQRVTKPGGFIVFDVLNENFYWEKIKHRFGKTKLPDIYKVDLADIDNVFDTQDVVIEKLNDFPIKSSFWYTLANIVNGCRDCLPRNAFHMLYYRVEV